jgi:phospholipase/carboxylesterase
MLFAMARVFFVSLLVLVGAALPFSSSTAAPSESLSYVERVIGAERDETLPLVIAVHGLGSSPEEYLSLFDDFDVPVRVIAPRAPDRWQVGTSWYPIDDPERAAIAISKRASALVDLMVTLRKQRPTRGLPIITGFSQGGVLSFALAAYHPQRIAAALPIAGMLPATMPVFRKAPAAFQVRALHGRDDQRIPLARAEQTVARLRKARTDVSLETFAGVGHNVPPAMLARFHALLRAQIARVTKAN